MPVPTSFSNTQNLPLSQPIYGAPETTFNNDFNGQNYGVGLGFNPQPVPGRNINFNCRIFPYQSEMFSLI